MNRFCLISLKDNSVRKGGKRAYSYTFTTDSFSPNRSLSNLVLVSDFGSFNFSTLKIIEKNDSDLVDRLLSEDIRAAPTNPNEASVSFSLDLQIFAEMSTL